MKKIGFIGLGNMGQGMAKNLLNKGAEITVYTRNSEKIKNMENLGAKGAYSLEELTSNSEIIMTCLPDIETSIEIITGDNGIFSFSNDEKEQIKEARKWLPFIENLPTEIVLEKYRIVHAGYDDSKPTEEQNNQQKMWGRTIFQIEKPLDNNRQIIVGHTPVQTLNFFGKQDIWVCEIKLVDNRPSVLGIDTGVFLAENSNPRLTALNLTNGKIISQERLENYFFDSPEVN